MTTPRGYLTTGAFLYVGPGVRADAHAHHAVQLVWAAAGRVQVSVGGRRFAPRAALVPAHAPHALDAGGATIALLLVEPHGARGAALDRRARAAGRVDVAAALAGVRFPAGLAADELPAWCDAVSAALGAAPAEPPPLSSVSRRAVAYVEASIAGAPRLAEAAARIGLSPTRLTHVFSREVGMPFRRFVLWTRIKHAIEASRAGRDLTGAAHAAGFSDAAHLSRSFRAMFGLAPSSILPLIEPTGAR